MLKKSITNINLSEATNNLSMGIHHNNKLYKQRYGHIYTFTCTLIKFTVVCLAVTELCYMPSWLAPVP